MHQIIVESNKFWLIKINFLGESTEYSDLIRKTKQNSMVESTTILLIQLSVFKI